MNRIRFQSLILLVLLSSMVFVCEAVQSVTLYVGDKGYLNTPSPPSNSAISQAVWASQHVAVSITEQSAYGCTVKVTEYFTGVAQVRCDYYYYWYDSYGYMHTNHATTYCSVYCKGVDIILSTTSLSLKPGEGQYIQYYLSPNINPAPTVRFYSSNTNVATVNSSGYVRGVSSGNAVITIETNAGPSKTCAVNVKQVNPTSVSIPSSITAYVGESRSVSVDLYPSGATTSLSWYSSDTNIAKVSSSGQVTGVAEGTATIYAKTSNGLYSNNCAVTVKYRTPTGITISPSSLYIPIGESKQLVSSVQPSNAKTEISWLSNNTDIVSVDATGVVTAIDAGSTTVTVSTDNGYSATCSVVVPPMPWKIEIPQKISLMYGTTRKLTVTPQPADAYLDLSWDSSDPSIVSVTSEGRVLALAPGVSDVTVTASNGIMATCRVEVEEPVFNFVVWFANEEKEVYPLTEKPIVTFNDSNIVITTSCMQIEYIKEEVVKFTLEDASVQRMPESIEMTSFIELPYNEQTRLDYKLYPQDYDIETILTWMSDDPQVVSVDDKGVITACGVGTAEITVIARNGATASCTVMVPTPEYYLVLWLVEGGFITYPFVDKPTVSYDNIFDLLVISSDTDRLEISPEFIEKFTINNAIPDDPYSENTSVEHKHGTMYRSSDYLSFVGCRAGMDIHIYTIDGVEVRSGRTDELGMLQLSLRNLPMGIYIVKSEEITCKIIKR